MKRSGFLKRRTPLKSDPAKALAWKRRTAKPLKAGKRTKEWAAIRAILKKRFAAVGITSCELRLEGCWHDNALGFLHTKKRRNCTPEELWIVVLGCNVCHDQYERLKESDMETKILSVIAKRIRQP